MNKEYEDYRLRFNRTSSESVYQENEMVEVRLTTPDGRELHANFATLGFIDYIFEKNRKTGECESGTYFCMPNMILVNKFSEETVRATVRDMISNSDLETYFSEVD